MVQEDIMYDNPNKSERGQAIVYLVLGLVVFLGFVALAIDGGMALADRRNSQNAADAASLAGGGEAADILSQTAPVCYTYWTCSDAGAAMSHGDIAAKNRAQQNNFIIDNNADDGNAVITTCSDSSDNKYIDFTVYISNTVPSNFLQIIYPKALHNEVQAVTRVHPAQPIGYDAAVIALNPASCSADNGIVVSGNGTINVSGGGMLSNGCVQGGGTPASAVVMTGTIEYHDPYVNLQNTSFSPAPQPSNQIIQPSDFYIPPPQLDAHGDCINGHNVTHLPTTMTAGLWCLKGSDSVTQNTTGIGVTIYLSGNAHLSIASNIAVDLEAPTDPGVEITGVLIYAANGANVTINGTSDDTFEGLVYAPTSPSQITLNGDANSHFYGQLIGWNVKINGNINMSVQYSGCKGYIRQPFIELYK
jgi:hypothetical protein